MATPPDEAGCSGCLGAFLFMPVVGTAAAVMVYAVVGSQREGGVGLLLCVVLSAVLAGVGGWTLRSAVENERSKRLEMQRTGVERWEGSGPLVVGWLVDVMDREAASKAPGPAGARYPMSGTARLDEEPDPDPEDRAPEPDPDPEPPRALTGRVALDSRMADLLRRALISGDFERRNVLDLPDEAMKEVGVEVVRQIDDAEGRPVVLVLDQEKSQRLRAFVWNVELLASVDMQAIDTLWPYDLTDMCVEVRRQLDGRS